MWFDHSEYCSVCVDDWHKDFVGGVDGSAVVIGYPYLMCSTWLYVTVEQVYFMKPPLCTSGFDSKVPPFDCENPPTLTASSDTRSLAL